MVDIELLLDKLHMSQKALAELVGVSPQAITNVKKGKMDFPKEWRNVIKAKFNVDPMDYIQANPLNITVQEPSTPYPKDIPIGKAVFADPKAPREINHDPGGKYIPFYDIEVFATISPAMGDVVALKPDTFIRIPMFSQGQYAVQVTGHSMKGYINHADWVVIRRITDRTEIIYGEPYLIVTKADNLKTVKFIKQGDSPDTLWLVPYNIEQFEPQEIKKSSILELYRVIGVFKSV